MRVPEILAPFIPEILAGLVPSRNAKNLPCPRSLDRWGGGRGMIGMLKRHEIEILLKAGHSQPEVARLSGVGLRSVRRIAREPAVGAVDDEPERENRRLRSPNLVETCSQLAEAHVK